MKNAIKKIRNKLITRLLDSNDDKYKKISFSQCGEDLIVKFIFDCLGINSPTYIDIGAHHPHYISNTALFYKNGCTATLRRAGKLATWPLNL